MNGRSFLIRMKLQMQNILNIKLKLEEQEKIAFGIASARLNEEQDKLKEIMSNIFQKCYETAKKFDVPTNLALGANIAGFTKVLEAMLLEGVC